MLIRVLIAKAPVSNWQLVCCWVFQQSSFWWALMLWMGHSLGWRLLHSTLDALSTVLQHKLITGISRTLNCPKSYADMHGKGYTCRSGIPKLLCWAHLVFEKFVGQMRSVSTRTFQRQLTGPGSSVYHGRRGQCLGLFCLYRWLKLALCVGSRLLHRRRALSSTEVDLQQFGGAGCHTSI